MREEAKARRAGTSPLPCVECVVWSPIFFNRLIGIARITDKEKPYRAYSNRPNTGWNLTSASAVKQLSQCLRIEPLKCNPFGKELPLPATMSRVKMLIEIALPLGKRVRQDFHACRRQRPINRKSKWNGWDCSSLRQALVQKKRTEGGIENMLLSWRRKRKT